MGKTRFKPPKLITATCSDVNKATIHKATTPKAKATYLKGQEHNHVFTAFIPDN